MWNCWQEVTSTRCRPAIWASQIKKLLPAADIGRRTIGTRSLLATSPTVPTRRPPMDRSSGALGTSQNTKGL